MPSTVEPPLMAQPVPGDSPHVSTDTPATYVIDDDDAPLVRKGSTLAHAASFEDASIDRKVAEASGISVTLCCFVFPTVWFSFLPGCLAYLPHLGHVLDQMIRSDLHFMQWVGVGWVLTANLLTPFHSNCVLLNLSGFSRTWFPLPGVGTTLFISSGCNKAAQGLNVGCCLRCYEHGTRDAANSITCC